MLKGTERICFLKNLAIDEWLIKEVRKQFEASVNFSLKTSIEIIF